MKFYVVQREAPNILGADTCLKPDLVRSLNTINKAEQPKEYNNSEQNDVLNEPQFAELFKGLGCLPGKYSIRLEPFFTPT